MDPPHKLQEELRKSGLSDMQFFLLKHGESRLIEIKEANERQEEQGDGNEEQENQDGNQEQQEQDQGLIDYLVDKIAGDDEQQD